MGVNTSVLFPRNNTCEDIKRNPKFEETKQDCTSVSCPPKYPKPSAFPPGSGGGLFQLVCEYVHDYRFFFVESWAPIMVPLKHQWYFDTLCSSRDESEVWFLGQEDGQPSCDEIYPRVDSQQMYFDKYPIESQDGSLKLDRVAWR